MARGLNKVMLIGYVGRDPEMRYTGGGLAIANFTFATSEEWKDKEGEKQERTEWHRISVFGKLAETIGKFVTKGSHLYLEGRIQTRKWQADDGTDRYTTEIVVNQMQFLGGKSSGGTSEAYRSSGTVTQDAADFDDDIPF